MLSSTLSYLYHFPDWGKNIHLRPFSANSIRTQKRKPRRRVFSEGVLYQAGPNLLGRAEDGRLYNTTLRIGEVLRQLERMNSYDWWERPTNWCRTWSTHSHSRSYSLEQRFLGGPSLDQFSLQGCRPVHSEPGVFNLPEVEAKHAGPSLGRPEKRVSQLPKANPLFDLLVSPWSSFSRPKR